MVKLEPHEMAAWLLGGLEQELVYKADLPGSRVGAQGREYRLRAGLGPLGQVLHSRDLL